MSDSRVQRIFVIASSLIVWGFAVHVVNPWVRTAAQPLLAGMPDGPRLLLGHLLIFSLPSALLCGGWWYFLARKSLVPSIEIVAGARKAFLASTAAGLLLAVATLIAVPPLFGMESHFHFNPYSATGNLFSNTWEEIIYRGLLFTSVSAATGSGWVGILISSAIFGWTHDQYPLGLRVYVGVVGGLLCLLYSRNRNFIAPVWAHNVTDWIVDLFL